METERAQRADRAAELSVPLTRVKGAGAVLTHTAHPVQPLPPRLCAPSDADLDTGDCPRVVAVLLLLFFSSFFLFSFFFWFNPSARSPCAGTCGGGEAALVSPLFALDLRRSCVRARCVLCVLRVACPDGRKWPEKWSRTRGCSRLAQDVRRAGDRAPPGARPPRSRAR